jgi:hypothetical protein
MKPKTMTLAEVLHKLVMEELPDGEYPTEEGVTFLVTPDRLTISAGGETRELTTWPA